MPTISGELITAVEDPTACAELAELACGDARLHAEEVVEQIIGILRRGEWPSATTLVTREMPSGTIVGLSVIRWEPISIQSPDFPADAYPDAVYLAVLTLAERFRGRYTSRDGQPLSEVLANEAYCHIASVRTGEMPPIQAFVDFDNAPSLELTRKQGFEVHMEFDDTRELLLVRPRGLGFRSRVPRPLAYSPCPPAPPSAPGTQTSSAS
jgi:hypothetical protein